MKKQPLRFEKISYPEPKYTDGYYWYDVPGDGLCGLHACFAGFREIKYLENMFFLQQHEW
jgi:hypothetical protein